MLDSFHTARVDGLVVPEAELALTTPTPITASISRTAPWPPTSPTHALGVDGPTREYYIIGSHEATDENQWRTEIGWPIFHTSQTSGHV